MPDEDLKAALRAVEGWKSAYQRLERLLEAERKRLGFQVEAYRKEVGIRNEEIVGLKVLLRRFGREA